MSCGVAQGVNGNHDGRISIPCSRNKAHRLGGLVGGVALVEIGEDLGVERLERRDHEETYSLSSGQT